MFSQQLQFLPADWFAFLHSVEEDGMVEPYVVFFEEHEAVVGVDDGSGQLHDDVVWGGVIVVGHGQVALPLAEEHVVDAVPLGVDHLDVDHGFHEEGVAVFGGSAGAEDISLVGALIEGAGVGEGEFVVIFVDEDAFVLQVVLVCDAVVQGLEHALGVVFPHLGGDEGVVGEDFEAVVADAAEELRGGQDEGGGVGVTDEFFPLAAFPHHLGDVFCLARCLCLAEQQEGGACDLPLAGDAGLVEEDAVAPLVSFGGEIGESFLISLSGDGYCLGVEIAEGGFCNDCALQSMREL